MHNLVLYHADIIHCEIETAFEAESIVKWGEKGQTHPSPLSHEDRPQIRTISPEICLG